MTNPYYAPTGVPQTSSQGTSAVMRNEFDLIAAGFDLLPAVTGNANKAVVINSAGTALTVTTGTLALAGNFALVGAFAVTLTAGAIVNLTLPLVSGTLATLAGAEAFTNKTSYNKVAITAPATGATLTIADGKTLTASNTLTFTGNDGSSVAFGAGGTVAYVGSTGTVTSVAQSFTGGLISVAGSPITGAGTLALTVAGTSGGVPYFSSGTTWATSAALAANSLVVGGGAGAAPATVTTGTGVITLLGGASSGTGGPAGTTAPTFTTSITTPSVLASANDSGALGASGTAFSDLFLASGGVINWAAGNATLTHATGSLALAGTAGASAMLLTINNGAANASGLTDALRLSHHGTTAGDGSSIGFYWNDFGQLGARIGIDPTAGATANLLFQTGDGGAPTTKVTITGAGLVGIGMTPVNILDITKNQAGGSYIKILNNDGATNAISGLQIANGTATGILRMYGSGFTTSGVDRQNGFYLAAGGAGGMTVGTSGAYPLYFIASNSEKMRLSTGGALSIGTTGANASTLNAHGAFTSGYGQLCISASDDYAYVSMDGPSGSGIFFRNNGAVKWEIGSTTATNALIFYTGGSAEKARFGTDGALMLGVTASAGRALWAKMSDNTFCATFENAHATLPGGIQVYSSGGAPNNTSSSFISCTDSSLARMAVYANGGIANYSANDVNLSDAGVKPYIENIADSATLSAALWDAHKNIDWNRHKYEDQSHDDWNYGYTAQGVRAAFAKVAPELVDFWEEGNSDLLAVYHNDVTNITGAVVTMLQNENEALKARVAALEAKVN